MDIRNSRIVAGGTFWVFRSGKIKNMAGRKEEISPKMEDKITLSIKDETARSQNPAYVGATAEGQAVVGRLQFSGGRASGTCTGPI